MPLFSCVNCPEMDIQEGTFENEYDFAEDAMDFEVQLAQSREVTFSQPLTYPLTIGSHIVCTGTPDEDVPWFAVNIGSGDADSGKADIAIHFNVRMPQCYVVRNTRRNGRWGTEETTSFRPFPFKLGRSFTIEVLVDETQTLWAVDGEHYCSYLHRQPSPFTATWVQVTGIKDASLNVQATDVYPMLAPLMAEVPTRQALISAPQDNEPHWQPNSMSILPQGVPEGYQIVIHGRLRPLLHSFSFDLLDKAQEWPHANVHVHVNVRAYVDSQQSRQLVVLNAWLGSWGEERRQRSARLVPGTKTTFRIVRGPCEWSVYADDLVIGELEYRAHADAVRALRIRGDFYPDVVYVCPSSHSPIGESYS